jgi:hypothetical protein
MTYAPGARVQSGGDVYQCDAWPQSGWCGISDAYKPGVGWAWRDAWTLVGPCGAGDGGADADAHAEGDAHAVADAHAGPDADAGSHADSGGVMGPAPVTEGGAPGSLDPSLPPCVRTVNVANRGSLATALGVARPGDCIDLADGSYAFPTITAKGTASQPIVIRAANVLKAAVPTGNLDIQNSAYVVVVGLTWTSTGTITLNNCDHCRLSRSRIMRQEMGAAEWTMIGGTSTYCRIDHNDFGPQNQLGNMIQLSGVSSQIVQYTEIDHNYFHDVHYNGGNGWESIRAGLSGWTFSSSHTVIEFNLFENDANDPEIISVKSSDNTVRHNTVRTSAGQISQRHGNRNQYYGNYILGGGVAGSAGIRAFGGLHKFFNNYVEGVTSFGILLEGGESTDTTGLLTDHKEGYDDTVAFNTVLAGGIILGGAHPLGPLNTTVAYNVVKGSLTEQGGSMGTVYLGNFVSGAGGGTDVSRADPKLVGSGGLLLPAPGSPLLGAATMASRFPFVTDDVSGAARPNPPAAGASELPHGAVLYGPLTATDVGPMAP